MDNLTDYLSGSDLRYQLSSSNDLRRCRVESSNVSFDTSIEKKFFIDMKLAKFEIQLRARTTVIAVEHPDFFRWNFSSRYEISK